MQLPRARLDNKGVRGMKKLPDRARPLRISVHLYSSPTAYSNSPFERGAECGAVVLVYTRNRLTIEFIARILPRKTVAGHRIYCFLLKIKEQNRLTLTAGGILNSLDAVTTKSYRGLERLSGGLSARHLTPPCSLSKQNARARSASHLEVPGL